MDDLSKITLEIFGSKTFQVGKSCRRNVSLPLQVALASINESVKSSIFSHESNKSFAKFELCSRNTTFSTGGQGDSSFLVISHSITDVSSKDNQIEIFLNVVHDLSFQKCLSSIVH